MLALRGVEVRFGDVSAVTGTDLDLGAGELLALLGPSGCGKAPCCARSPDSNRGRRHDLARR